MTRVSARYRKAPTNKQFRPPRSRINSSLISQRLRRGRRRYPIPLPTHTRPPRLLECRQCPWWQAEDLCRSPHESGRCIRRSRDFLSSPWSLPSLFLCLYAFLSPTQPFISLSFPFRLSSLSSLFLSPLPTFLFFLCSVPLLFFFSLF